MQIEEETGEEESDQNVASGFDLSEYIAFELYRGDEYAADSDVLSFVVTIAEIAEDRLYFKMKFDNPSSVSIGMEKDIIAAKVIDETFFSGTDSPNAIEQGTQILTNLPKLIPSEEIEEFLEAAASSIENTAQTMMTGQLIMAIVLSVSLKQLWNLFNVM